MVLENDGDDMAVDVLAMDFEGRGVGRVNGKTIFVEGALPSEKVRCRITKSKKQFDEAQMSAVLIRSAERVIPKCGYFDTCGGCVLQFADAGAQVAYKQRIFEEQLQRIGRVQPQVILPPIYGLAWGYRQRARLAVAVDRQGQLRLGFRARKSHDVVDIDCCDILPDVVSRSLSAVKQVLKVGVAAGDAVKFVEFFSSRNSVALNVCTQGRPSEKLKTALQNFSDGLMADKNPCVWQIWLQQSRQSAELFYPKQGTELFYELSEFNIKMPYQPGDFTQVNDELNELMVARAVRLLDVQPGERIADLFCGLGNFSLPLARAGATVIGIEGADYLVERARKNAELNGLATQIRFEVADLFDTDERAVAKWGKLDKMLLDPPRNGAYAVVQALHTPYLPKRIVYVSCNPSTFARDAAVLVEKGYVFKAAGIMNLFAQTAHVESLGWFERPSEKSEC